MFTPVPLNREKAEILLINTDFAKDTLGGESQPANHLGLWRLGSYLESRKISVQILTTTGLKIGAEGSKKLANWLKENHHRYRTLGFHLLAWNISQVLEILRELKNELKDKPIFFGGPLATASPAEVLVSIRELEYKNLGLIAGYGEFLLERALQDLDKLSAVKGLWSWQRRALTRGSVQRFSSAELDQLPFLSSKLNSFYELHYEPMLTRGKLGEATQADIFQAQGLDVNQGCPFACSYCSAPVYGREVAAYSPKRVVDEIQKIAEATGFFIFTFTNSNLLFCKRDWVIEFCEEILARGMEDYLNWNGYHHPGTIDLLAVEDLKLLKKAGCEHIVVGVQTVDPTIGKLFNRPAGTRPAIERINTKVKIVGQSLVIDYITGVPGEDTAIIADFFDWCTREGVECRDFILKIYPNTQLQKELQLGDDYELVPILGNLAPELDSYAVIPRQPDKQLAEISEKLRLANKQVLKSRPVRVGKYFITAAEQTRELIEKEIPSNPKIPEKVKQAMLILLKDMLAGESQRRCSTKPQLGEVEGMMKNLILTPDNGPPMMVKMRDRLKVELGEEKFESLRQKYLEG